MLLDGDQALKLAASEDQSVKPGGACSGSQLRLICPVSSINQTNPKEHQGLQPQSLLLLWEARNPLWKPQTSDLCMQQGGSHHSLQHSANCSIWDSCTPSLLSCLLPSCS